MATPEEKTPETTTPEEETSVFQISAYTGVKAGTWHGVSEIGAVLGGTVTTKDGTYANGEACWSHLSTTAELNLGHKFDLRKVGIDVYAGAKAGTTFYDAKSVSYTKNDKLIYEDKQNAQAAEVYVGAKANIPIGRHLDLDIGLKGYTGRDNDCIGTFNGIPFIGNVKRSGVTPTVALRGQWNRWGAEVKGEVGSVTIKGTVNLY